MGESLILCPRVVRKADDVEAMRLVRNSCREFMTGNQEEISAAAQRAWWTNRDPDMQAFIYTASESDMLAYGIMSGDIVGYGLVRTRDDGRLVLSGGLTPEWRNKGLGKQLFAHLAKVAGTPCWLDVLVTNLRARVVYAGLGFVEESRPSEHLITMVKR